MSTKDNNNGNKELTIEITHGRLPGPANDKGYNEGVFRRAAAVVCEAEGWNNMYFNFGKNDQRGGFRINAESLETHTQPSSEFLYVNGWSALKTMRELIIYCEGIARDKRFG